ncbi:MAG: LTA synthase family protein [Erysipelotrichaceae bacterium]|nr:LTA synthase family protein [Erysipelotrichaceae bacterium]
MNKKNIGLFIVFVSALLFMSIIWSNNNFSTATLNQLIYHTKFTGSGFDIGIVLSWLVQALLPSTLFFLFVGFTYNRYYLKNQSSLRVNGIHMSIVSLTLLLVFTLTNYNVYGYFTKIAQVSDFYETNYVDPSSVNIDFTQKRNLIYIYMESVETTYLSTANGGYNSTSLMPELEQIALENTNFSNTDALGGWQTLEGTQWTIASMISQNAGIPVTLKFDDEEYEHGDPYLMGTYSLGEILADNGYKNVLIKGSDADFAGTSNFFETHGNYEIHDYNSIIEEGYIPADYKVFWGMEDSKTYTYAKEKLEELSSSSQPFNLTMVTVNTHTPEGYLEPGAAEPYDDQYSNVILDASKQVSEFIDYISQQDYYDNTTIIVVGDHLSMYGEYFASVDVNYQRTPFNVIINSGATTQKTANRQFSSIDMFPTTIAALGGAIEGDSLGLGVNLYSDRLTLIEKYGFDYVNTEIQKSSNFYQEKLLYPDGQ